MLTFLLVIIYLAFISLGLPDSLLGSVWPVMKTDLSMPLSAAGVISMIITGGTIISSFISDRIIKKFGTGKITFISVFMTAAALFGFSIAPCFYWLCLLAVPLGLGAGAVDSALNNFVALHYKARHMSWLHCFWGIGATAGPLIMSLFLSIRGGWKKGYFVISIIQFSLVAILFFTLFLWKNFDNSSDWIDENDMSNLSKRNLFSMPIVKYTLLSFFCYSAIETTTGLWGSSFLVGSKGILPEKAAQWISLFYFGITIGRLLTGVIAIKINNQNLIRSGQFFILLGGLFCVLPLSQRVCMIGFILIGLGCAPIFPCMLHDTPKRMGVSLSQSMMGIQMAFAYIGSTFMPPLFGILATKFHTSIFPIYIFLFLIVMIVCVEKIHKIMNDCII